MRIFFTYQNLHLMLYSSCSKKEYVKGEKAAAQRETSSVLNQKHVIFGGFIEGTNAGCTCKKSERPSDIRGSFLI